MNVYPARCVICGARTDWSDTVKGPPTCTKCYDKGCNGRRAKALMAVRNETIMQRRAEGWSREKIAAEAGISLRTLDRVITKEVKIERTGIGKG